MNSGTFILGALNGLIIALLAVGFVLVYKANRFLNLAQAQLGAVSAMLLAKFVSDEGWNFWAALVVCLALGIATGMVVERFLVRPVRQKSKSPVRLMILTIGVSQLLLALTYIPGVAPTTDVPFPQPFTSTLEVGGVVLSGMSILILIVVPILLAALAVFLGYTSIGRQIRAAASNPDAARLCGVSVNRVSLIAWGVAGGLSALAAMLSGPTATSFNAAALGPFLLMLTMGAAAFGAFVSIPIAVVGGLGLGVTYQVVLAETSNAGTAELWVFGVILLVVVVRGRAIGRVFATEGSAVPEQPRVRVPKTLRSHPLFGHGRWWLIGGALLVTVVAPQLSIVSSEGNRFLLTLVLVYALVGVSLTMLVGWAGQVSLGHWAVVGLAAYITARWSGHGWTLPAMIIVIGLIGAGVTIVIGLPALRIPGLTLAVTTLGFAVIAPDWLYLQHRIGGDTPFTTFVEFPSVARGLGDAASKQYLYYVALIVLVLAVAAAAALRRSAIGRTIIAVRDNERACAALGIQPAIVKLRVLGVSGFIAAAAGVLYATAWQRVTPLQFGADISIAILAIPVIGGLGSIGGAVAAAVMLYASTFFIGPHVSGLFGDLGQNVGFLLFIGGIGVVGGMLNFPNGIAGKVQESWQARLDRKARALELESSGRAPTSDEVLVADGVMPAFGADLPRPFTAPVDAASVDDPTTPPLVVGGVAIRFGGVAALDGVDIVVRPGEIVGLIGPNGAGKTTLMDVISGTLRPHRGSVRVFGHDVTGRAAQTRARLGVARSFQDASSFAGLTVREAVQLALAGQGKTGLLPALIGAPWVRAAERDSRHRAEEIVEAFGLTRWADALTAELSTGTRRVCELAVQVATEPRLLLLDEPTAGVAQRDAEAFGPLMRRIRDELDCSILVIEHDMPLLMGLCDRAYALEAGQVIAEGTPTEIRDNPIVIASYLGTDTVALNRSGQQAGSPTRVAP